MGRDCQKGRELGFKVWLGLELLWVYIHQACGKGGESQQNSLVAGIGAWQDLKLQQQGTGFMNTESPKHKEFRT